MRIKKIEISKFKGFYDTCTIDLNNACKNLLVYGENGTGKSSLFQALMLFLESDANDLTFGDYRNIFAPGTDGHIRLTLRGGIRSGDHTYEWSPARCETGESIILDANKAKGFLDYKSLLETYFLHHKQDTVNLFDLLINNLLANLVNDITSAPFLKDWRDLQAFTSKNATKANQTLFETKREQFNQGLIAKLAELQTGASEILKAFEYDLELSFRFNGIGYNYADPVSERKITGQEVILQVTFRKHSLRRHHVFLNEAKLSAIALAIYLASVLLIPKPQLKLLVLDDVLIGLDMSNRLPILGVLENFFPDHQKVITTYDRQWYEMVRLRTQDADWKYIEFYRGRLEDFEMPILKDPQSYLDKAREHLNASDYKACAVYIRTAFEEALKKLAAKKRLKIPYTETPEKLTSQDFWDVCKESLESTTTTEIETYRKFVLNPLSHSGLTIVHVKELEEAIVRVEKLQEEIKGILAKMPQSQA